MMKMKKNLGNSDKIIRMLIAVVIMVLYFTGKITGTLAMVLLIIGLVFLVTALISFCPLYSIFGINTCKDK